MYELQNGIQFETIPTSNAENYDFKNSDYPSISGCQANIGATEVGK